MDRSAAVRKSRGTRVSPPLGRLLGTDAVNMTPAERVAQRTWSTLGRARQLRARFGEETLTDLLVLDMLPHQRARGFWLRSTTKHAEAWCGADLFVAVRHPTRRWSRFALQAKKLYPTDEYPLLNGGSKCISQLDKLERFARQLHALPLYLLYNHSNAVQPSEHWHCLQPFSVDQLGCTLVPSWHIRRMIFRPPPRNFDLAHKANQARPWRCAFDCPDAETSLMQMAFRTRHRRSGTPPAGDAQYDWRFEPMADAWPDRLFDTSVTQLTRKDVDQIRGELSAFNRSVAEAAAQDSFRSDERWLYPARLLIVDRS